MRIIKLFAASVTAAFLGAVAPANATLLVDGITFDLRGLDGLDNNDVYKIENIEQITFLARVQAITDDTNGNGLPDIGEDFSAFGSGAATGFFDGGGADIEPAQHRNQTGTTDSLDNFEVTFRFRVDGEFTDLDPTDANFVHTACLDANQCLLELYVENLNAGGGEMPFALGSAHATADDGILFATFALVPGDGGGFNFNTGDGSDDATFELVSALAGVLLDSKTGTDLNDLQGDKRLVTLTDANFDTTTGAFGGVTCPTGSFFGGTLGEPVGGQDAVNFCVNEDGSVMFAVPEPSTLALLGTAFILLGGVALRRRRSF